MIKIANDQPILEPHQKITRKEGPQGPEILEEQNQTTSYQSKV
jgi:hypothetical protein